MAGEVSRDPGPVVHTGLSDGVDGKHYLSELVMRRTANMSRALPSVIRSPHAAYLYRWHGQHEQHYNDGSNHLAVGFAKEGVDLAADWRGEVNVPSLTQVRPDLLMPVSRDSGSRHPLLAACEAARAKGNSGPPAIRCPCWLSPWSDPWPGR